jgi:hypothetical protein
MRSTTIAAQYPLQTGNAQSQRCKQCVQKRNNTNQNNIQHQLHREDQRRDGACHWVDENEQTRKPENRNRSSNCSEDLHNDQTQQCTNGNELTLLLRLGSHKVVARDSIDGTLCLGGIYVRQSANLVGGGCDGSGDQVELCTNFGCCRGLL